MLEGRLNKYQKAAKIRGKGPLSVMLVITRMAISKGLPLDSTKLLTKGGGQVIGLSKSAVQNILQDYEITRVLAEEAGRTSRGSISKMQNYVKFLNELHAKGEADLETVEKFWVQQVKKFFAGSPFKIKLDPSKSLRSIVADLLNQAEKRQKEMPGTMYVGIVMQHLVGAKLELAMHETPIDHHGASVADAPTARGGDFLLGDAALHVTTAPTEALIRKCKDNLNTNLHPIIITSQDGAAGAAALSKASDLEHRIDILEIEQFVATNLFELSGFSQKQRPITVQELVEKYNAIIEKCETDPSLKINIGK